METETIEDLRSLAKEEPLLKAKLDELRDRAVKLRDRTEKRLWLKHQWKATEELEQAYKDWKYGPEQHLWAKAARAVQALERQIPKHVRDLLSNSEYQVRLAKARLAEVEPSKKDFESLEAYQKRKLGAGLISKKDFDDWSQSMARLTNEFEVARADLLKAEEKLKEARYAYDREKATIYGDEAKSKPRRRSKRSS